MMSFQKTNATQTTSPIECTLGIVCSQDPVVKTFVYVFVGLNFYILMVTCLFSGNILLTRFFLTKCSL